MKVGSDVNRIVLDVLPRLAPGVVVHVQDIFVPYEYPRHWVEDLGALLERAVPPPGVLACNPSSRSSSRRRRSRAGDTTGCGTSSRAARARARRSGSAGAHGAAADAPGAQDAARSTSEVEGAVERWAEGLDEETQFWYRWLRDRGGGRADDYALRTDPEAELQPHIRRYLDAPPGANLRILDVGSGPLTVLGKRWGDAPSTSPRSIPSPTATRSCSPGSGCSRSWPPSRAKPSTWGALPPSSFDLVYAQNCIDHSYDPLRAIQSMLELVRPGACCCSSTPSTRAST